jgi:glucan phosphoethanolaminetransferase (alkaline phosphatase superfamily)
MLLSIFSSLYELIIGENADFPEYREGIFDSVGLITFIFAIVICLLFFVVIGRLKSLLDRMWHWVVTLVIVAVIAFALAFTQAKGQLGDVDSYLIRFSIFNAIYSVVYFFIFSLLFQRASVYARHLPFKIK